MAMTEKFITDTVEVIFSHLHKPDVKFGADAANHSITVLVDEDLQKTIDSLQSKMSATKINGMRTDDEGRVMLKAKTKLYVKKNVDTFPCVDANARDTEAIPFSGDKVRIQLAAMRLDRDNSMSLFLNGVQIVEKNNSGGGFEATEGFDGSSFKAPVAAATDEDATVPDQEAGDDLPF